MESILNISASSIYNKNFTVAREITFKTSLNIEMYQDLLALNGEKELIDTYTKMFERLLKQGLDNLKKRDSPNKNVTIINNSVLKQEFIDGKLYFSVDEKIKEE